jgi:voltage-gated potassium channel
LTAREKTYEIIFGHHSRAGQYYDIVLLLTITASVGIVIADSIPGLSENTYTTFSRLEWFFTLLFTFEYILRLWCSPKPSRYAGSFFGVIDLVAIAPAYLGLFLTGPELIAVFRIFRLLRVFRILGLSSYVGQAQVLASALYASRFKIVIFLVTVLSIQIILGTAMYLVEGPEHGFTSIPMSIYWAVVTMTTVGYGDITPVTAMGKTLATLMMILGYAILAVPTGIVTLNLSEASKKRNLPDSSSCRHCGSDIYDPNGNFCSRCGRKVFTEI